MHTHASVFLPAYYANDNSSIINATQEDPDSGTITFNATVVYFTSQIGIDLGAGSVNSGSPKAKALILIPELAHLLVVGFLDARNNSAAGSANNELLSNNFDDILKLYSNLP